MVLSVDLVLVLHCLFLAYLIRFNFILGFETQPFGSITEIVDYYLQFDVKVKIEPLVSEWLDGSLQSWEIKEIKIEDL